MSRYCVVYLGGREPSSPEEGQKHFAEYMEWLNSLGDSVLSPMNPFKSTHRVNPDRSVIPGSSTSMSGYTILEAESMDVALAMVKNCPFLNIGGTLEVSQLVEMNP